MLDLEAYRGSIALDEPFLVPVLVTDDEVPQLVGQLVTELFANTPSTASFKRSWPISKAKSAVTESGLRNWSLCFPRALCS